MIDTIEKTKIGKIPLFTAGEKDSNENMFEFLRVLMPNQQSLMFMWVFRVDFTRLIPKNIIVNNQGFDTYVDTTFPDIKSTLVDETKILICRCIHRWIRLVLHIFSLNFQNAFPWNMSTQEKSSICSVLPFPTIWLCLYKYMVCRMKNMSYSVIKMMLVTTVSTTTQLWKKLILDLIMPQYSHIQIYPWIFLWWH